MVTPGCEYFLSHLPRPHHFFLPRGGVTVRETLVAVVIIFAFLRNGYAGDSCISTTPFYYREHYLIMDTYVKVGNDLQLAVKNIILSKKAFLKQSRCIKILIKKNDLLQKQVERLELNNKELRALELLTKQNQSLKNQLSQRDERENDLDMILAGDTFVLTESVTSKEDSTTSSDFNSTGDEEVPVSPKKRKRPQKDDDNTPSSVVVVGENKTVSPSRRSSRRISQQHRGKK